MRHFKLLMRKYCSHHHIRNFALVILEASSAEIFASERVWADGVNESAAAWVVTQILGLTSLFHFPMQHRLRLSRPESSLLLVLMSLCRSTSLKTCLRLGEVEEKLDRGEMAESVG
jgi:hypothetical protein